MFVCCTQWLQSVVRLQTDITKFLSSTSASDTSSSLSSAKPTASVIPQVQPNCGAMTTEPAAPLEIPAAMETETDEAETTVSADVSDVNVSLETLSKESHDSSMSDAEHRSCGLLVEDTSSLRCESNGCNSIDDAAPRNDLSSADNCCQTSCYSDSDVMRTRCSDYEAASVLSDMQQLVNIAAAATSAAPGTTFSAADTSLICASDTRSTSLKTVDCSSALPAPLSCNTSGQFGHYYSV